MTVVTTVLQLTTGVGAEHHKADERLHNLLHQLLLLQGHLAVGQGLHKALKTQQQTGLRHRLA